MCRKGTSYKNKLPLDFEGNIISLYLRCPPNMKKETFPSALGLKLQEQQQEKHEWTNSHKHTMKDDGWFGVRKVDGW